MTTHAARFTCLTSLSLLIVALLACPGTARSQDHEHHHAADAAAGVGVVRFPSSANAAAQASFIRGVALLHSFEYDAATDAFREARKRDPHFALAGWMEAFAQRQVLWSSENIVAARHTLASLGPDAASRLALAPNARERAYGAAIEALFADVPEPQRAKAFADSMRALSRRDPADLEAAAFASLALQGELSFVPPDQQPALIDEAIALGERVFRANPRHPGAAHYLIHAYDDPARAARGVSMARAYARIAPASEHVLHMPSHIFVQLGLWDDMRASNEAAWAATQANTARRGTGPATLDYHALHWLHYAYVQQGRLRAARALDSTARRLLAGIHPPPVTDSTYEPDILYGDALRALALVTLTGDWRSFPEVRPALALADPDAVPAEQDWIGRYMLYLNAVAHAMRGDPEPATRVARSFRAAVDTVQRKRWFVFAATQLDGLAARTSGDTARAVSLLEQSATLQEKLLASGPPLDVSSAELLGATLLAAHRPVEAAAAYERALVRTPNRAAALLGLARSRTAAGDQAGARRAYATLLANWRHADAALPQLAEVRAGARGR